MIDGTRTWITNGVYGTCFAVLTKTDPEAEPRHEDTSMFIAAKGPGFSVGRRIRKLGYRSIDSAELMFGNFRIGAGPLVGGVGGYSYSADFDVERYYRDSTLMCIGEGTNEMQPIIIARQLAERNPA